MRKDNFFVNNPKLATFFLSVIIIVILGSVIFYFVNIEIISSKDGQKYSIADKVVYKLRCKSGRNIRLRELEPNRDYVRIPEEKFETLEHKEYLLRSDKDGIIKPSFINDNPDLQLFFLGGSTTECETVDEEFRFPYLVGRQLEEKLNIKVNSDNAARSGNNSLHSINILINKLLPYNPDVVVMMHNVNDLSALVYEGSYWNQNKTIAPIDCVLKNEKAKIANDQWKASVWKDKVLNSTKEQDFLVEKFAANLKLFINICKSRNIIPVLMTQPNRITNNPDFHTGRGDDFDKIYKKLYARFSQAIRQVGKKENVLVIDLEKKIPSDKKYIYDSIHVNKEGSVMEAEEISKQLQIYLQKINFQTKNLSTN